MDAHAKIAKALKDLDEARNEAAREMHALRAMVKGLPCDSYELLQLLDELADAEVDVSGHHGERFDSKETSKPYALQSQECKDDWTRCYNRRNKAIADVVRFALALRKGGAFGSMTVEVMVA